MKGKMRKWALAELQKKHERIVNDYIATISIITIETEDAICKKYDLFTYVKAWENEEVPHAHF